MHPKAKLTQIELILHAIIFALPLAIFETIYFYQKCGKNTLTMNKVRTLPASVIIIVEFHIVPCM